MTKSTIYCIGDTIKSIELDMFEWDKVKYSEICHFRLDYNYKKVAICSIATARATVPKKQNKHLALSVRGELECQ